MKRHQITSRRNPRVQQAVALRSARARQQEGRFLIDGVREIARAVAAGVQILEVYVCRSLCQSDEGRRALAVLDASGADVFDVNSNVFEKLSYGNRSDGIVVVAATPLRRLSDIQLPACPLVAVLVGMEKPGNVGAIARSADAAGISAVIVAEGGTDLYNPNSIRASLGTIFNLPYCASEAAETLQWLRDGGLQIVAARVDADKSYTAIDYKRPTAMLLGGEAGGLSADWTGEDILGVRIAMLGIADSLNVSAAAAVLFYEALRQRT